MTETKSNASYGPTNPSPTDQRESGIMRFGSIIGLKPEKERYYRELHAEVWPGVIERLKKSNVKNYSIHLVEIEGRKYLFSYLEYTGLDFKADMASIASDPETKRWWKETDPCQYSLDPGVKGIEWTPMEMLFWME